MSGAGEDTPATLVTQISSTTGGVMTVEVGAITGELELLTRPAADGSAIEVRIRYTGARDIYTVAGSPMRTDNAEAPQDAHQRIVQHLTTPGKMEGSNELPVDLSEA